MKKEVERVIPPQPEKVIKNSITICDLCYSRADRKCCLCQRDICSMHIKYDPEEYGDHPEQYCNVCFDLKFHTFRKEILEIQNKSENQLTEIDMKIKKKSLEKSRYEA